MNKPDLYDTLIIGAGAAGMMCAAHAAAKGGRVLVVDHAKAAGEKIRISGGGRCNFTNLFAGPGNFLSQNPHFAKSALKRYTQYDFIDLVTRHGIPYHEKTLGQLFCDTSAKDVVAMLLAEMAKAGVELRLNTSVRDISKTESGFSVALEKDGATRPVTSRALVVACGGKSIPKMGATGFAYQIADRFGLPVTETRPALVPLTFGEDVMTGFAPMAGVATDARVSCNGTSFDEAILFTHRGLSGPAILQISSFWRERAAITVNLMPQTDVFQNLRAKRSENGRRNVGTVVGDLLPKRLATHVAERFGAQGNIADMSDAALLELARTITDWELFPTGTEGYRTAEVTLGGIDTDALNSKTMETKPVPGLFFIGEAVDVTGWLGGYNFQWAWSSGWAAGTAIAG